MIIKPHDLDFAVVGHCSVCGQGRQFVARENSTGALFVYCEECEAEWNSPADASQTQMATHGMYTTCTLVRVNELLDHDWFQYIVNTGR